MSSSRLLLPVCKDLFGLQRHFFFRGREHAKRSTLGKMLRRLDLARGIDLNVNACSCFAWHAGAKHRLTVIHERIRAPGPRDGQLIRIGHHHDPYRWCTVHWPAQRTNRMHDYLPLTLDKCHHHHYIYITHKRDSPFAGKLIDRIKPWF